jgi:hypothetical protein
MWVLFVGKSETERLQREPTQFGGLTDWNTESYPINTESLQK